MKNFKTFEQFVNESVNESAKLIDEETGKVVKLPYKTKDFRGDPITVKGFTAPHKPSSSGRIQTDQGEYFPGVAGVKIIGHKYDDANESVNEGTTPTFKKLIKRAKSLGIETVGELDDLIYNEFEDATPHISGADYEIAKKHLKLQ